MNAPVSVLKKSGFHHIIKNIPFFACLSEEELLELEQVIVEKRFSKGQVILHEEDTPNFMYFVESGKVKVVQMSEKGKEQILAIHKAGDFFGEMALMDGKTSPATVIAMEDVRIGMISKENFKRHVLRNEKMLREIISLLCLRLRESWMRLKVLSFGDAENKVRTVLGLISIQWGVKDHRGRIIALKLTHEDIADYASVSRETVTRLLGKFLKDGEIELLENRFILLRPTFFKKMYFM